MRTASFRLRTEVRGDKPNERRKYERNNRRQIVSRPRRAFDVGGRKIDFYANEAGQRASTRLDAQRLPTHWQKAMATSRSSANDARR